MCHWPQNSLWSQWRSSIDGDDFNGDFTARSRIGDNITSSVSQKRSSEWRFCRDLLDFVAISSNPLSDYFKPEEVFARKSKSYDMPKIDHVARSLFYDNRVLNSMCHDSELRLNVANELIRCIKRGVIMPCIVV